ncbi:Sensor protein KdpD [Cedecea neteri]|uniref:Sensor protein KdpD n=1 Tax=Cedecea neteri TaxID=158822 RepID=A0A2X2SU58_9ENTR|nr:Sensor protein KdpD [Cedecea neteri]
MRPLPAGALIKAARRAGTDTLPGVPYRILPLSTTERTLGLLVVEPENLRQLMIPEQQRLLETFTLLVATALDRFAAHRQRRTGQAFPASGSKSATRCWPRFRTICAHR